MAARTRAAAPAAFPEPLGPGGRIGSPRSVGFDPDAEVDTRLLTPGESWPFVSQGRGTYGPYSVNWFVGDPPSWVRIGNYCSIAEGVEFMPGGNHRPDFVSTFPFRIIHELPGAYVDGMPGGKGDITVGSDVWIGRDALVMSGVTVGHGAVIAARAVVTRDVRPYAIVGGNPAREIRRRFPDEIVTGLLASTWWDWPEAELLEIVDILNSGGDAPERLIAYARQRL